METFKLFLVTHPNEYGGEDSTYSFDILTMMVLFKNKTLVFKGIEGVLAARLASPDNGTLRTHIDPDGNQVVDRQTGGSKTFVTRDPHFIMQIRESRKSSPSHGPLLFSNIHILLAKFHTWVHFLTISIIKLIDDKIGRRPETEARELKVQARSPTYIKGRRLGTKFDKARVRNCIYLYSTQLTGPTWGRQDFNLLTRTQTIFWLNKRKTNRLDKELTIEFKKIQDSVRQMGYAAVIVLVLPLGSRHLRECVNNCVRTQPIMNYETRHYVSLDTQNRRTRSKIEQNLFLVRLWSTTYEILCDETRHHVLLNTQNRTIPPKNEREKIVQYLRATMYENGSLCVSEVQYVSTSVRVQRNETEQMRAHTRIIEPTQTVTNDEACWNKSMKEYHKIKDMNATERTRIPNLTTHLLNLKTFLLRFTQEYQWAKATLCLTENWKFSLALTIFPERTPNKSNRNGLKKITTLNICNKIMMRTHLVLVYLLPLLTSTL